MTFFLLLPVYPLGKADKRMIQEFFSLVNKVRIYSPPPQKNLNSVLVLLQETHQRANRIKDDTWLSDPLAWIKLSCDWMCLKWKFKLRCSVFTAGRNINFFQASCSVNYFVFVLFCLLNSTFIISLADLGLFLSWEYVQWWDTPKKGREGTFWVANLCHEGDVTWRCGARG